MLDLSYEKKEFPPYFYEVDRSKIKELCMAIGDDNPIFFDKDAAVKAGYKDTPAPLTFATVMNFWGYPKIWDIMKEIGIDVKRLLHAKEAYEYMAPLYPGDKIKGTMQIESLRSSSLMEMANFKTTYTRGDEIVLVAKMSIVVMPNGEETNE